MKIAILHDYFDEIGGAEITLCQMARGLKANIFTTNIDRKANNSLGFGDVRISSIGRIPRVRHLKQLWAQMRFLFLRLERFDLYIFGGCHSIYGAGSHKPNLWYCFSPERGLYDLRYVGNGVLYPLKQVIKGIQIYFNQRAVREIERIVVPSHNIRGRVGKYYGRDSDGVIHSPVETGAFKYSASRDYWLSVQRIDPYKNIELQLEAFSRAEDEKLIIVGGTSREFRHYFRCLQAKAPPNVAFLGPIFDREELADLYAGCKGFIATSQDEDFGMTVVEAMASGKPVIAPNEGGYKETIVDGVTGKLIDDINPEKLIQAINEIAKDPARYKDACLKRAAQFDTKVFIEKIKEQIKI